MLLERMLPWVGSFSGQVVVVTGASGEIGRRTALGLARCGADVALVARRRTGLKALQTVIRSYGRHALVVPADVTNAVSAQEALSRVSRSCGRVDLLINNAGAGASTHPLASDELEDRMRMNVLGATYMTQAALPLMRRLGRGSIINVAPPTEQSFDGSWGGSLAAKFALIGLTETLRKEARRCGAFLGVVLPSGSAHVRNGRDRVPLPPGWVAAATILAAKFRLGEIDAPPSFATVEALRSVAPRAAEAVSGWVAAAQRLISERSDEAEVARRQPGELLRFAFH